MKGQMIHWGLGVCSRHQISGSHLSDVVKSLWDIQMKTQRSSCRSGFRCFVPNFNKISFLKRFQNVTVIMMNSHKFFVFLIARGTWVEGWNTDEAISTRSCTLDDSGCDYACLSVWTGSFLCPCMSVCVGECLPVMAMWWNGDLSRVYTGSYPMSAETESRLGKKKGGGGNYLAVTLV